MNKLGSIRRIGFISSYLLLACLSFSLVAQQITDTIAPESASGISNPITPKNSQNSLKPVKKFIVAAANPYASEAAYKVLEQGGNAIDAMVAIQTVLGLVEPQSSGLGGGAFLVYYDAKTKKITTFDGRETAPFAAPNDLFMSDKTTPMKFFDAVVGGRSVGTPGTVKLLWETHKRYGSRTWRSLLKPAIELASKGFIVSPRMANAVVNDQSRLETDEDAAQYFFPEGKPIQQGNVLKNPNYADTLSLLAKHGGDYFYHSGISQAITKKVHGAKYSGFLAQKDFDKYQVIERPAICSDFRQYQVCGMGPPSSGAIAVSQTLGILESFDLTSLSAKDPLAWQLVAEASRLAFADRGLYIADPDFITRPKGLLAKKYLSSRAKLIQPLKAAKEVSAGVPDEVKAANYMQGRSPEQASTTHFVIVDNAGNIVSMTSTIENGFGSHLMVKGFMLNNELTDFSFPPTYLSGEHRGQTIANSVEGGKRPRSSMSPTIVFKNQKPYLALGSPGGSRIINYVTNVLVAVLEWNMPLQEAFDLPHITNRFGTMSVEANTFAQTLIPEFEAMGYSVSSRDLNSGLHGVLFTDEGMVGAADYRREGQVLGQ